nr:hypothetical protein [Tanacetum cinerariifolium]
QDLNIWDIKDQDWKYDLARAKLVLETEELLLPLAEAEKGSFIVIPFRVLALNVNFDFKIDLIVFGPKTGSAPVSFSSGGRGCYRIKIHQLNHNLLLKSQRTTEWLVVFLYDLFEEILSSLASAMRALTLVTSFSSDGTSSSSQSYVSTMRLLFFLEDELGAKALELRRASLALDIEQIPTQKKKILGIDQLTKDTSSSGPKDPVFVNSLADNSEVSITSSNKPKLFEAEDFTLSNYDTGKHPLPPLEKLTGAEPVFGPKTIKSILKSKFTFKAKTLKGITINEPFSASARGNKSSSVSKTNLALAGKLKNVKIENDPPLAIVMKELNEL